MNWLPGFLHTLWKAGLLERYQLTTGLSYCLSMDKIERDNEIIRRRALGATKPSIAREMGVSLKVVEYVLRQNHFCITHLAPPAGMSMRTAYMIRHYFGLWPSEHTVDRLSGELKAFMRAPSTRRRHWVEFGDWLSRHDAQKA